MRPFGAGLLRDDGVCGAGGPFRALFASGASPDAGVVTAVVVGYLPKRTNTKSGSPITQTARCEALTRFTEEMTLKSRLMRPVSALLLTAMVLMLMGCGGSDPVVFATGGNYHPFNLTNDQDEVDGLERELGDELCRRAELECQWVLNEWETMIPHLLDEEFDVILAGMSITGRREEVIDFTQPYYPPTPSVYLARAGEGDDAVKGRVGASPNTIYSDYFTEQGLEFVVLGQELGSVDAVLSGAVDAVLVDHGYAVQKLAEHGGLLEIVGPRVLLDQGLGVGVRPGSELKDNLDEGLASMKADGTLNALIVEWLGEGASTFE